MISHPTAAELSEAIATFEATPGQPGDPQTWGGTVKFSF